MLRTKTAMDSWQCPRCTFKNDNFASCCGVCRSSRPRRPPMMPDLSHHVTDAGHVTDGRFGWNTSLCPDIERRIVFLGRTGSGKSATANNILRKNVFESSACGSSVTKKCQRGTGNRNGRHVEIIDSPGLFDTAMTNADITREVIKCIGMTAPGPHAFVLVVRIDRFTQEEQDTVEHFKKVFGEGMLSYLIILFTRKDDLHHDNKTLQQYLQNVPKELKDLLQSCNYRCIAFNNRGDEREKNQDVEEFLSIVDKVIMDNGGTYYSSEMYEEAEKTMKKREEQLKREHEEKTQKEKAKIRREYELKFQKQMEDQSEISKQLRDTIAQLEKEKAEAKKKEEQETMRSLTKDLEELKLTLEQTKAESKAAEKKLELEREKAEKDAQKRAEEEKQDFRDQAREEVNKESGSGFSSLLKSAIPAFLGLAIQACVPVVGKVISKVFTRK